MTAIQFYKWVQDIDHHWEDRDGNQDVLIFPWHFQMDGLFEILDNLDDGGIEIRMQKDCFAIWASDILDYYDIELKEVFNEKV